MQGPSGRGVVAYATSSKVSQMRDTQNRISSANERACGYCGGKPHAEKANCPAMDKKCAKCGKMNHFARVCRSSAAQTSEKQSGGKFEKRGTQFVSNQGTKTHHRVKNIAEGDEALPKTSSGRVIEEEDYAEFLR